MRIIAFLAILFSVLLGCTKKDSAEPVYTMGFTPAENAEVMATNGKYISELIQKKTGVKVKAFVASDYTALIEAMRTGQVQFAWLAPFGFVMAEKRAGAKLLLKSVRNGKAYFYSCIFVRKDSPIKRLEDLKGKNIAWVDPASTSGFIIPKAGVMEEGYNPDKFVGKQIFAGGHDSVLLGVMNKSVDAGATFTNDTQGKSAAWNMLGVSRPEFAKNVRIVWVSKPIPNDTFSTTEKFYAEHKDVVDKVTNVIKELGNTPEGKSALDRLYKIDSFIEGKKEEFLPLIKAAEKLNIEIKSK